MKKFLYSDCTNWGYFTSPAEFHKAHPKNGRLGKRLITDEDELAAIPPGWRQCVDDRTAIEPMPDMRSLIKSLT